MRVLKKQPAKTETRYALHNEDDPKDHIPQVCDCSNCRLNRIEKDVKDIKEVIIE